MRLFQKSGKSAIINEICGITNKVNWKINPTDFADLRRIKTNICFLVTP